MLLGKSKSTVKCIKKNGTERRELKKQPKGETENEKLPARPEHNPLNTIFPPPDTDSNHTLHENAPQATCKIKLLRPNIMAI